MLLEDHIQSLIVNHARHLQKLKEQQASFGLNTPPHILTQIEDIEATIEILSAKLNSPQVKTTTKRLDIPTFSSSGNDTSQEKINLGSFFDAPSFTDRILRPNLISKLNELIGQYPVIAVEGLSGCGKSYLVSSYLEEKNVQQKYKSVIWHDPRVDDTIDDFLALIETGTKLSGLSSVSKCKELLHIFRTQQILLVIDNFEQVDQISYSTLINLAARYGTPTTIILISRVYVDFTHNSPHIGHLEVRGFSPTEMSGFLSKRGLKNTNISIIQDLINKTDGLPLAASLFSTLALDFGRSIESLLSGEILSSSRLHNWFSDISLEIGEQEQALLSFLSLSDAPFNIGVIRMACGHEGIENSSEVFENLQRTYLVQDYTPYRWNVHHLIAMFCKIGISFTDSRVKHLAYARHYLRGFDLKQGKILDEAEFVWKVRACKHFQQAKDYDKSALILRNISKTVKTHGYYEMFIQLSNIELKENDKRSPWVDYDHAHCLFIIGRLKQSLQVLEPLLYSNSEKNDGLKLAIARLYAEILGAMGKPKLALTKLQEVMNSINENSVYPIVLSHAKSIEVSLLIRLEDFDQANTLCQKLLADSIRRKDGRGGAVAFTLWGIILQLLDEHLVAQEKFREAVRLFRDSKDKRGLAWGLTNLSISEFELGNRLEGVESLQEGIQINADIGNCTVDYLNLLQKAKSKVESNKMLNMILNEIQRVSISLNM